MDILTHTLCGVAVGTVLAGFSQTNPKYKLSIIAVSGMGGALPDMDAISLWSKFDGTFGRIFQLNHSGKEIYTSKFWYSHHAFFHSLLAGILFSFLIGFIIFRLKIKSNKNIFHSYKIYSLLLIGFFSGFVLHLLCDMPTPRGAWNGVALFFPIKNYIGGTGQVWWWNNYDVFLIVSSVIVLNLILLFIPKIKKSTLFIFIVGFVACLYQIKTRPIDFNKQEYRTNYEKSEIKSKEIQQEILGEKTYNMMKKFDSLLPFYF